MITVISGPQGSGKTTQALAIGERYLKPYVLIDHTKAIPKDADLIIYKEMSFTGVELLLIISLLVIHRTSGLDAVFTTQDKLSDSTKRILSKRGVTMLDIYENKFLSESNNLKSENVKYTQHIVEAMDETLIQKCFLCGEVIANYQSAMFSPGTDLNNIGWRPGVIYVSGTNPRIIQTEVDENAAIKSCFGMEIPTKK